MTQLIVLGVIVLLVVAGLIAWRTTVSVGARRRDLRRALLELREAKLTLYQIGKKINVWAPGLDEAGTVFANEVRELIHEHDTKLLRSTYDIKENDL